MSACRTRTPVARLFRTGCPKKASHLLHLFGERDPFQISKKKLPEKVAIERSTLASKWMLNSYLTRYQKSENTRMQKNVVYSFLKVRGALSYLFLCFKQTTHRNRSQIAFFILFGRTCKVTNATAVDKMLPWQEDVPRVKKQDFF